MKKQRSLLSEYEPKMMMIMMMGAEKRPGENVTKTRL